MINPELLKNYWLEITPHRLIATPVVIALLFVVIRVSEPDHPIEAIEFFFYYAAVVFACVIGAYYAASNFMIEFMENTWDQQRLSPLSPWALTWGKVTGGTLFPWYGTLICLAGYLFMPVIYGAITPLGERLVKSFVLVELAILLQGLSILLCLNLANNPDRLVRYRRNYSSSSVLVALLFAPLFLSAPLDGILTWYGRDFPVVLFLPLSLFCFTVWTLLGAYRLMRQQMQFKNGQLPWLLFIVFLMVYIPGFVDTYNSIVHSRFMLAVVIGLLVFYMLFLSAPIDALVIRRCINAIRRRDLATLWIFVPAWVTTYIVTAVVALSACLVLSYDENIFVHTPDNAALLPFALLLFALRDLLIAAGLSFGGRADRVAVLTVLYLAILYGVLPTIAINLDQGWVLAFVWPVDVDNVYFVPVIFEILLLAWWVRARWQRSGV